MSYYYNCYNNCYNNNNYWSDDDNDLYDDDVNGNHDDNNSTTCSCIQEKCDKLRSFAGDELVIDSQFLFDDGDKRALPLNDTEIHSVVTALEGNAQLRKVLRELVIRGSGLGWELTANPNELTKYVVNTTLLVELPVRPVLPAPGNIHHHPTPSTTTSFLTCLVLDEIHISDDDAVQLGKALVTAATTTSSSNGVRGGDDDNEEKKQQQQNHTTTKATSTDAGDNIKDDGNSREDGASSSSSSSSSDQDGGCNNNGIKSSDDDNNNCGDGSRSDSSSSSSDGGGTRRTPDTVGSTNSSSSGSGSGFVGLQKLVLRKNDLTVDGAKAIASGLKRNKSLNSLSVVDNSDIDYHGLLAIARAVFERATTTTNTNSNSKIGLKFLDLSNNNSAGLYDAAKIIAAFINQTKYIDTIQFNNNNIGDEGIRLVSKALPKNNTLHKLCLCDNNISDDGLQAIANIDGCGGIQNNYSLRELDLRNFNINNNNNYTRGFRGGWNVMPTTNVGGTAIVESLRANINTSLEFVHLPCGRNSNITDKLRTRLNVVLEQNRRAIKAHWELLLNEKSKKKDTDNTPLLPVSLWPKALSIVQSNTKLLYDIIQNKLVPELFFEDEVQRQQKEQLRKLKRNNTKRKRTTST